MINAFLNKIKTAFYVPPHTHGDSDFDGHGPNVNCSVNLAVSEDKKQLIAKVYMKAIETQNDWTTCEGATDFVIFSCTGNQTIEQINLPASSNATYTDTDHDEDFVVAGVGETNTLAQNSNWQLVKKNVNDLVDFYRFIGDTEGDEAGTKTGVEVFFNTINITLDGAALNEINLNVPLGIGTCGNNTCGSSASAALLNYYGITETCDEMNQKLDASPNLINVIRQVSGLNIGIDPDSMRDRLNEVSNQFTLEEINNETVIDRIIGLLQTGIPVLALTGWGSKTVLNDYCRSDDSVSLNPNSVLHYMIVDGFNFQTNVFSVVSNGGRIFVSRDYLRNVILWHPENVVIQESLYLNQVKPGKIIFGKVKPAQPNRRYTHLPKEPVNIRKAL
jgi:hypothetical protein